MELKQLNLVNYRNIEKLNINFSKKFTLIYGDNAQGKTNILESIYLFCYLKSFRQSKNIDLIGKIFNKTSITSLISHNSIDYKYNIKIDKNNKSIYLNDNRISNNSFFEYLKCIIYFTDELNILRNSNSFRKNYIDRGIFLNDYSYLNIVNKYIYILKSRNLLIKTKQIENLDVWTDLLIDVGTEIRIRRFNYIKEINLLLEQVYKKIFNNTCYVSIRSEDYSAPIEVLKNNFSNSLLNKRNNEINYGKTLDGPHLDKFDFYIDEKNARFYGSQGELRSLLFSIKISQILLYKKIFSKYPLFLIDDISSEIDNRRLKSLFEFMNNEIGQVIITSTNKEIMNSDSLKEYINYKIVDGYIK